MVAVNEQHGSGLRLDILGPLQAWDDDVRLELGRQQQRVVLGVLALHANRSVGRKELIEAVWGDVVPTYAVNLVQKHVSALRRALAPAGPPRARSTLLAWSEGGYRLTLPPHRIDLERFDHGVALARSARASGDLTATARALHAALRLWRGPVLDGLASPLLDAERDRLTERWLGATEERIEVDLSLGDARDLVTDLRRLVARHPMRERLWRLLMQALYQGGQGAEALTAYRDARQCLLNELGVEPGPELQSLHQRILAGDPGLLPLSEPIRVSHTGLAEPPPPVPAQLPHAVPDFIGREVELALLDDRLRGEQATMITAITGPAGVGKTSLAVHWAHRVRHRFRDGQLYVNLQGCDPDGSAVDSQEALRSLLESLAVPPQRIPTRLQDRSALYRSLLAGREVLVVLDDAVSSKQVRPLLPGSPGCVVVITSRDPLSGLVAAGAVSIRIDCFTEDQARAMLRRRLEDRRAPTEPEVIEELITACRRLPLALAAVAARAVVDSDHSLAEIAAELRRAHGGLDGFVETALRSTAGRFGSPPPRHSERPRRARSVS